ncbi:MAG: hypothetical protein L3J24_02075 [Xanthomonadales bacterium]|nr:hypothetical protein [Xanthomonadales bacterium]
MRNKYHNSALQMALLGLLAVSQLTYAAVETQAELVDMPSEAQLSAVIAAAKSRESALITLLALTRLQDNYRAAKLAATAATDANVAAVLDEAGLPVVEQTDEADDLVADIAEGLGADLVNDLIDDLGGENSSTSEVSQLVEPDYDDLVRQFTDDRAWLQSLKPEALRLSMEPLDLFSNGFFTQKLLLELKLHGLTLELGSELSDDKLQALLVKLVFEKKQRTVVRALMPYLLRQAESRALTSREDLQQMLLNDVSFNHVIAALDLQSLGVSIATDSATEKPPLIAELADIDLDSGFNQLLEELLIPGLIAETASVNIANGNASAQAEDLGLLKPQQQPVFEQLIFKLRLGLIRQSASFDVGLALYTLDTLVALKEKRSLVFTNGLSLLTTALLDRQNLKQQLALSNLSTDEDSTENIEATVQTQINKPAYPLFETSWLPLLAEKLPQLQQLYSQDFALVDASTKTALALTSEAFIHIVGGQVDFEEQRRKLVDAHAILDLLLPDAGYYFLQPLRESIREAIAMCTSIVAAAMPELKPISSEQYDGCVSSFLDMGSVQAKNIPLSGNSSGPWERQQLRRELSLTPWQRINYLLAYLTTQYSNSCVDTTRVINPLEWSVQAAVMAWFTAPWPSLANTEVNENAVDKMLDEFTQFNRQMTTYRSCLLGTGGDLIQRMLANYKLKLDELIASIAVLEHQFRQNRLSPGADIKLDAGAEQNTNYRPEALVILPCDSANICDMAMPLPATLALVGLFPSPYLVADQSRMGSVEICYDKVRWVARRSTQARDNAPEVANYYAHLGFSIKGRFHQNGKLTDVFERSFVSPDEYHYLFAENTTEVLESECPMEIIGQPIITKLSGSKLNIVPNRLTYLTAYRALPSRLLAENWEKGAEWRDRFVTGSGVEVISESDGSELLDSVNNYLHSLRESREAMIYTALLAPPLSSQQPDSLAQRVSALSIEKALLRSTLAIFHGELLGNNEWVRAAVAGTNGLLDRRVLRRLREANVTVGDVGALGRLRSQRFGQAWQGLFSADIPESIRASNQAEASISPLLATAWLQLKYLQQQQLQAPLSPLDAVLISPVPPSENDPAVPVEPNNM